MHCQLPVRPLSVRPAFRQRVSLHHESGAAAELDAVAHNGFTVFPFSLPPPVAPPAAARPVKFKGEDD